MEKIIEIPASEPNAKGEKVKIKVHLKATANVPRMYRIWFQRDIIKDMQKLKVAAKKAKHKKQEFGVEDLSIFENVAYCMARLGDPENTPKNINDWLDQFSTFSIYEVLPDILELWELNLQTTSTSKKNLIQVTGK